MIGEFNLYGMYFPWLFVLGLLCMAVAWGLRRVLARLGFYRFVWHPALFDLALFIVLLYGASLIPPHVFQRLV